MELIVGILLFMLGLCGGIAIVIVITTQMRKFQRYSKTLKPADTILSKSHINHQHSIHSPKKRKFKGIHTLGGRPSTITE